MSLCGVLVLILISCTAPEESTTTFANSPKPTRSVFVEPLPASVTPPPAAEVEPGPTVGSGDVSASCEAGWTTPAPGSAEWQAPLRVIAQRMGLPRATTPVVVEMRVFVGPESPPSDKAYIGSITRWYVKLAYPGEPGAEGRFLVEERGFGTGLVAVAPMASRGFASPDWVGFQYDPAAPERRYPDLPGLWRGLPYDFVAGGEGLTIPGLPDVLVGCMDGT